ncbi:hypothetical protein BS78_06G017800, partial [Paspalum vaginatum]
MAAEIAALPARSLAAARCVCTAWRGIVDGRALLRPHLLPRSVFGVFINYVDYRRPQYLFARPCSSSSTMFPARVDGMLSFLPKNDRWRALDHCNGLLLLCNIEWESQLCVCNPATRRWTVLPPHAHQMADTATVVVPVPVRLERVIIDAWRSMEWPPSPWTLRVFSSRTGHWEERALVREAMPAGTVREMRLSLSKGKYQTIKAPANIEKAKPYLGKLHNSVCFGIVHDHQLKIWILHDSCGTMEWVLKCQVDVGYYAKFVGSTSGYNGSWKVEEDKYYADDNVETLSEKSYEWDSDNDDTFTVNFHSQEDYSDHTFDIMGFHPYKEVVFLVEWFSVASYHLNTSKIQYLGYSRPKCYPRSFTNDIYMSRSFTLH